VASAGISAVIVVTDQSVAAFLAQSRTSTAAAEGSEDAYEDDNGILDVGEDDNGDGF
jgi:hypothetical protein